VKARIPTVAISRTLQAAATFGMLTPSNAAEVMDSRIAVDIPQPHQRVDVLMAVSTELIGDQEISAGVRFPVIPEWDRKSETRFLNLVDREAKAVATRQELNELELLTDLRRRFEAPRTGEEVLREYEQYQLVRDLLQSLTRYVKFVGNASGPSSARSRAKTKA